MSDGLFVSISHQRYRWYLQSSGFKRTTRQNMSETSPESAKGFSLNLSRIPGRSLWRLGSVSSRSLRQTPSCFAAESNTTRGNGLWGEITGRCGRNQCSASSRRSSSDSLRANPFSTYAFIALSQPSANFGSRLVLDEVQSTADV